MTEIESKIEDVKLKIAHYSDSCRHINESYRKRQLDYYMYELNQLKSKQIKK